MSDITIVKIATRHPEHYVLANVHDGTCWVIRDGQWRRAGFWPGFVDGLSGGPLRRWLMRRRTSKTNPAGRTKEKP